jgi:hypothetical protein
MGGPDNLFVRVHEVHKKQPLTPPAITLMCRDLDKGT